MFYTALFSPTQLIVGTSLLIEYQLHLKIPRFSILLKGFFSQNGKNTNLSACESAGFNTIEVLYGYDSIATGG
jgi:hypothetical protein